MKKSFYEKVEQCRLASIDALKRFPEIENRLENSPEIEWFLSKGRYCRKKTLVELWTVYGLTNSNLSSINIDWQSDISFYNLRYELMKKWIVILFDGKIAFESFFDIERDKQNRIREKHTNVGLKCLNSIVEIEKIAQIVDSHFTDLQTLILSINRVDGAVINYPTKTDDELVEALVSIDFIDIFNVPLIYDWIQKIAGHEGQTLSEKLHFLNIFINSLKLAKRQIKNANSRAYLEGLYSQFLLLIHSTLDLTEWLCDTNYETLDIDLLRQFTICKLEHGWKSSY